MKKISEMTDRELQEGVYQNIRNISKQTRKTSVWMDFFGWIGVISAVGAILYALSFAK